MKILYSFLIYCFLLLGGTSVGLAQTEDPPAVVPVGKAQPNRVLVRWVPNSERVWALANQYGYYVERRLSEQNGIPQTDTSFVRLTAQPLLPATAFAWTPYLPDSVNHQTLYSALYDPTPAQQVPDTVLQVHQEHTVLYQRYVMALLAADQSYSAARMAALGYIDHTAQANERYEYRITTAIPTDSLPGIGSPTIKIGLSDYRPLVALAKPVVEFGRELAALRWIADTSITGYNSYWVERSTNGTAFVRQHTLPFVNVAEADSSLAYQDSLPKGRKKYYYRLQGRTIFDEVGVSAVVFGQSKDEETSGPKIKSIQMHPDGGVELSWQFPSDTIGTRADTLLNSFFIGVAPKADDPPVPTKIGIAPTDTAAIVTNYYGKVPPGSTLYFTLFALRKDEDTLRSYPVFVEPADTLAPAIPVGLQGGINLQGIVTLNWQPNVETDLMGYKVFRSQRSGEEASALTDSVIVSSTFRDTLVLNTLNAAAYYHVVAVDRRYNESALSAPLTVFKPDTIRPTAPLFLPAVFENSRVRLRWANSSSRDVVQHTLFKKETGSVSWKAVAVFTAGDTTTVDEQVMASHAYTYLLVSQDRAGLVSDSTAILRIDVPASKGQQKTVFTALNGQVDPDRRAITLNWQYDAIDIAEYQLYRAVGTRRYGLWKMVAGFENSTTDENVQPDSTYRYSIRAFFKDGTASNWKDVTVIYQDTITRSIKQPPYVSNAIPSQTATAGQPYTFTVPATTFSNAENRALTLLIVPMGLPGGLTSSGGTLTGTPQQGGAYTVTVKATDDRGATGATTFQLIVNGPPVLLTAVTNQTVTIGQSFTYAVPTNTFFDYGGTIQQVTILPTALPTSVTASDSRISGSLSAPGPFSITVQAIDNDGAITTTTFQLIGNQPPQVVTAIANQTLVTGTVFTWTLPANTFQDVDGQLTSVIVLASGLPPGLSVQGTTLVGTPTTPGNFTVTARAIDNLGAVKDEVFRLAVVLPTNQLPVIVASLASQTLGVGESFQYTIPAGVFFDPDGQITLITLTGTLPAGLVATGGQLSGIPTTPGSTTLTITATDDRGGTVSTFWPITVISTSTPMPVLAGSQTICAGLSALLTVTDCGGVVTWSTGGSGASLTVNPTTTTSYTAICTLNGVTTPVSGTALVTVLSSPTVVANHNGPLVAGQTLLLSATATSGTTIRWNGPNGFTSTATSATIANSTTLASGLYSVTATSSNGCSVVASTSVTISPLSSYTMCIEAEDPVLTTGTGTVSTDPLASGGAQIGNYSSDSTNRRFTLNNIPATGFYQILVRYIVPAGSPQAVVLINDDVATITLSQGGYNVYTLNNKTLNQGSANTLRIEGNETGSFLLDQVCIVK